jgi:hypothetical protein
MLRAPAIQIDSKADLNFAARRERGFISRDCPGAENNAKNSQNTALQVALTRAGEESKQNRRKRIFAQVQRKITRDKSRVDAKAISD